jgi:hypothetical protein
MHVSVPRNLYRLEKLLSVPWIMSRYRCRLTAMQSVNPAGWVIHSAVHEARPDVVAAVHCHSVPSKAFSSLGCMLEPINQDACR